MRKTVVVLAGLILVATTAGACGSSHHVTAPPVTSTLPPPSTTIPPDTLPPLPAGSSYVASLNSAPLSYARMPGGPIAGQIGGVTWYNPTVRPIMGLQDGWLQIGLDTRPNGSTGWVPKDSVTLARTPYKIVVSISQRSLTLYKDGQSVYSSPVGVGAPQWPTPVGTTFVSSVVSVNKAQLGTYGPTVLTLGAHSDVFTEFDGGDGTVAIHGYPSNPASTKGAAVSHGCVRVSPETMDAIKVVPSGTPVQIVA